ncbi:MAG: hypothetical protein IJZ79_06765 [Bacilli bacterium]|nr:hypothetical protein [Bacilli bacterium]
MVILFVIVSLIIAFLVFLMFIILRKTVRIVNSQTKSYFVDKLQGYDDLITDKENKLYELEELIKNKEKGIKEDNNNLENVNYAFDTNVIDLFNSTEYQNMNLLKINKIIDENFVVNYEELIKDFLSLCDESKDYDFCLNLRGKFSSDMIYNLKVMTSDDREKKLKDILNNKEYKVYETFKLIVNDNSIENFVDYLSQLIDLNNPKVKILVGNKNENYDHLSDCIETVLNDKIYRGIKIIYRNKVYDFSLSERNV